MPECCSQKLQPITPPYRLLNFRFLMPGRSGSFCRLRRIPASTLLPIRARPYSSTTLIDSTSASEKWAVSPPVVSILYPCRVFRISSFDSTWYRVFRKSVVVTSATSISLGVWSWNAAGGKTSGNASGCRRVVSDRSRSARERFRPYRKRIFCHGQAQVSYVQNARRAKIPVERFIRLAVGDPDRGDAAPQTPAPRNPGAPD